MTDQPVDNNIDNREELAYNTHSHSLRGLDVPSEFGDVTIKEQSIESDISQDNSDDNSINSNISRNNPSEISPRTMATFDTQMDSFLKNILIVSPNDDTGKSLLKAGFLPGMLSKCSTQTMWTTLNTLTGTTRSHQQ